MALDGLIMHEILSRCIFELISKNSRISIDMHEMRQILCDIVEPRVCHYYGRSHNKESTGFESKNSSAGKIHVRF